MNPDTYYKDKAENYEAARKDSKAWAGEDAAVRRFVDSGPVIDCPVGTGRFVPFYLDRGLDFFGIDLSPDMLAIARTRGGVHLEGSIFKLPFHDRRFAHAVCIRMFQWFEPTDLSRAMAELSRVADSVVFSIRLGVRGKAKGWHTYTHDYNDMLDSLHGMMIVGRHDIEETNAGIHCVIKARHTTYADVLAQFSDRPEGTAQKLAQEWAKRMGVECPDLSKMQVRCEYWTHTKIGEVLKECASRDKAMMRNSLPRRDDLPMTCFIVDGKHGLIDGRHRANLFQRIEGRYPVLVLR